MTRSKLVLFTDGFPYGKGEKTFIVPELERLSALFNVTVVSMASDTIAADASSITPLPGDITVIRAKMIRPLALLAGALRMPFTTVGRTELKLIWGRASTLAQRFKQSVTALKQYGLAWSIGRSYKDLGLFNDADKALYYTFWLNHCNLALAFEKQKQPEIKLISRVHGYELYDHRNPSGRQPFQWFQLEECNKIIFAAQGAMDYFIQKHRISDQAAQEKLTLSRIGSSQATSAYLDMPSSDHYRIVSCSNAIPLKRIDLLIDALALLNDIDFEWIHFGGGSELPALKALAQEKNIPARFADHVSNEELRSFYDHNQVGLFVTTTSTEGGCPVSITEALAYGIPIVGTAVGGIPEQIDGNGILLSENPTPEQVAAAIRQVLGQSPQEIMHMRERSHEIFDTRFDQNRNLQTLIDLFRSEAAQ